MLLSFCLIFCQFEPGVAYTKKRVFALSVLSDLRKLKKGSKAYLEPTQMWMIELFCNNS